MASLRILRTAAAASFLATLTACGGGGDDGAISPPGANPIGQSEEEEGPGFSPDRPSITGVSVTPTNPRAGYPVRFHAAGYYPGNTTYAWDFGDGSPISTEPAPSHVYASAATYQVKFTATGGDLGRAFSTTQAVDVRKNASPSLSSSLDVLGQSEVGHPLILGVQAGDPDSDPLSFTWTIDGQVVSKDTPDSRITHTFTVPGMHSIEVYVSDGFGGVATQRYLITVAASSGTTPPPGPVVWQSTYQGALPPMHNVRFFDGGIGWALSGSASQALRTVDGGATWQMVTLPKYGETQDDPGYLNVAYVSRQNSWMVGCPIDKYVPNPAGGGTLYFDWGRAIRSSDDGKTWENVRISMQGETGWSCLRDIQFIEQKGWLIGERGSVMTTTDGGQTWSHLSTLSIRPARIQFVDYQHGWAVGTNNNATQAFVARTTDGGATWSVTELPRGDLSEGLTQLSFVDRNTGYVTGRTNNRYPYPVFKTTDGGVTWTAVNIANNSATISLQFLDASTGYALDLFGDLRKTTNGGLSWSRVATGPRPLSALALGPQGTAWSVSNLAAGGTLYKVNLQ